MSPWQERALAAIGEDLLCTDDIEKLGDSIAEPVCQRTAGQPMWWPLVTLDRWNPSQRLSPGALGSRSLAGASQQTEQLEIDSILVLSHQTLVGP